MKTIIDVSVYQDCYQFDKFKLLIDSGVDAVIIRAGCYYAVDRMCETFVGWCRKLNVPFALYWYFYPQTNSKQANVFIETAKLYPDNKGLWLDVEEHTGSASFLDGYYKSEFMKVLYSFPNKLVGIYSGGWVLDQYIPNMYRWAAQYPYWDAHYVKYYTWWMKFVLTIKSISSLESVMAEIERHPVSHAKGFTTLLWQCITFIPFTELTSWQRHLDYNICTDENFVKLFGGVLTQPLPLPVTSTYKVNTSALTVRATPPVNGVLGKIVGWRVYGQTVTIVTQDNGWGLLSTGGWIAMRYVI